MKKLKFKTNNFYKKQFNSKSKKILSSNLFLSKKNIYHKSTKLKHLKSNVISKSEIKNKINNNNERKSKLKINSKKNLSNNPNLRKLADKIYKKKLDKNTLEKNKLLDNLKIKIDNKFFLKKKNKNTKFGINEYNKNVFKKYNINVNNKDLEINNDEFKLFKTINKDFVIFNNKIQNNLFNELNFKSKKIDRKRICELIYDFLKYLISLKLSIINHMNNFLLINPNKPYYMKNSEKFMELVKYNNLHEVKEILNKNRYFLFQYDYIGLTPLHWAIKKNYFQMTILLCKFKPKINEKDFLGRSPLYYSFYLKNDTIQKILLTFKANPWSNNHYKLNYENIKNNVMITNLKNWRVLWILKLNFKTLEFSQKDTLMPLFYIDYFNENIKPYL